MAALAGSKNQAWITHGVPIAIPDLSGVLIDMSPMVNRMGVTLEKNHIAVYTVEQSVQGAGADIGAFSTHTLQLFSGLTFGRAYACDAVDVAVRQARTDTRASYTIGYFPPAQNWNGKCHKLRVTSDRPRIRFNANQGYYASLDSASGQTDQAALGIAAGSPFDALEIGLRVKPSTGGEASQPAHFQIRKDASNLLLRRRGDLFEGDFHSLFCSPTRVDRGNSTASLRVPIYRPPPFPSI
jgi:hypothetical protein